jgi:hypothetical protein
MADPDPATAKPPTGAQPGKQEERAAAAATAAMRTPANDAEEATGEAAVVASTIFRKSA